MKDFALVGLLDIFPLRNVCRQWRIAADTAAGTLRAVSVRSSNRGLWNIDSDKAPFRKQRHPARSNILFSSVFPRIA